MKYPLLRHFKSVNSRETPRIIGFIDIFPYGLTIVQIQFYHSTVTSLKTNSKI